MKYINFASALIFGSIALWALFDRFILMPSNEYATAEQKATVLLVMIISMLLSNIFMLLVISTEKQEYIRSQKQEIEKLRKQVDYLKGIASYGDYPDDIPLSQIP